MLLSFDLQIWQLAVRAPVESYILLSGLSRLLLMNDVHSELLAEKPMRGFVFLTKQIVASLM